MKATKTTIATARVAALAAAAAVAVGPALLAPPARAEGAGLGEVDLEVGPLRNSRGDVLVAVFRAAEDFPDPRRVFREARVPAAAMVRRSFPALPPGEYAILVVHDEDRDGDLDTTFLGIPSEGYGASRNDLPRFSAPKWKGNRFTVTAGAVTPIKIRLRYF